MKDILLAPKPVAIQSLAEKIPVVLADLRWVHINASQTEDGNMCNVCKSQIYAVPNRRSIWENHRLPCGGFGKTANVYSLGCLRCNPNLKLSDGEGIYTQEIVHIESNGYLRSE